jgi:putative peptidoglycan lipid II flippase
MGKMPIFTITIYSKLVARFFTSLLPSMLGLGMSQILVVLNVLFASRLAEGSHSFIYLADRLLEFPQSLLSVSLGVALLPTLSEYWARGEKAKLISTVHEHIRLLFYLTVPAALGLYFLAEPIVRAVYERGQFSSHDTVMTAKVLQVYALMLLTTSLHRVTVPAFYAMKNTWLPALNSALCVGAHFFVASWATEIYGLTGLVGATAFTGLLNLIILLVAFKIYFKDLGLIEFFRSAVWNLPGFIGLALVCISGNHVLVPMLGVYISLPIIIGLAILVFFALGVMTKSPEADRCLKLLSRKL